MNFGHGEFANWLIDNAESDTANARVKTRRILIKICSRDPDNMMAKPISDSAAGSDLDVTTLTNRS